MHVILCVKKRDIFVAHARTLVIPRFSMAGMVYPTTNGFEWCFTRNVRKLLTSKVKLPLLDGVDVRRDGLDELGRELHGG